VLSEGFGGIEADGVSAQVEVRASWTPGPTGASLDALPDRLPDLRSHVEAWTDLLSCAAGLPPVPTGVVPLSPRPFRGRTA